MKKAVFLTLALMQLAFSAHAEDFEVVLGDEVFVISGDLEVRTNELSINNVKARSMETNHSYLIRAEGGWGERPLDTLCRQITDSNFPFALGYGQMDGFGSFFFGKDALVLVADKNKKGDFSHIEIQKGQNQGAYYKNLLCTKKMIVD